MERNLSSSELCYAASAPQPTTDRRMDVQNQQSSKRLVGATCSAAMYTEPSRLTIRRTTATRHHANVRKQPCEPRCGPTNDNPPTKSQRLAPRASRLKRNEPNRPATRHEVNNRLPAFLRRDKISNERLLMRTHGRRATTIATASSSS